MYAIDRHGIYFQHTFGGLAWTGKDLEAVSRQ